MKYCTACKTKYDDSVSFCTLDGEVLEADPASLVDTVLDGQYQMEALLGKGGMGAVYRARHILLGDRVAIKVLPPEVRTNAEWLRRFRREGQAARRFRHPNAVTVYDLRTAADGTIYMVMEYVEGRTLDAEMKKRGRLSAAESFEILTPIMSVLDTAHAMGVVHRDLKPENIMIGNASGNGEPVVKLLDLGIAKMREVAGVESAGTTALTMAGQVLGTPYYMSPEQWGEIPRDENLEIDGRADIYSLGLVFYEMVAGRRCYTANTLHELRREHVSTVPRPLHEVVPSVPKGFSDAIQRATAKDRADRQPTAAVLASELKAGLSTSPFSGSAASSGQFAETLAQPGSTETNSDVNAPTVIGMDASITSIPSGSRDTASRPSAPKPPLANAALPEVQLPSDTVVESAAMVSSVTVDKQPMVAPSPSAPRAKSKAPYVIAALVLIVAVMVVTVAGVFIYRRFSQRSTSASTGSTTVTTTAPPIEVGDYWLMLEPSSPGEKPVRVAGLVGLASGQAFQMRFVFTQDGYLYIIGPGQNNNQPTAFLTNKPSPQTGLLNNEVTSGHEFSFPQGDQLLGLDKKPGTDRFTVIFSKTRLESPASLNAEVTGDPMPSAQLAEFNAFVSRYMQKEPLKEIDDSNKQAALVRVKVDANRPPGPVVFEIRIQHN
ncbi:MAG TPA: serine/threonine-protein kinase [Pyrinomonadaceae bacterium]|nr:serine/threonine-protein kinase [Pyrinomonadaceae bacterium]